MIEFPSLEACKESFREHMADPKWVFECDDDTIVSDVEGVSSLPVNDMPYSSDSTRRPAMGKEEADRFEEFMIALGHRPR